MEHADVQNAHKVREQAEQSKEGEFCGNCDEVNSEDVQWKNRVRVTVILYAVCKRTDSRWVFFKG